MLQKLFALRQQIVNEQNAILQHCAAKYENHINQLIAQETLVTKQIQQQFDDCLRRIDAQIQNVQSKKCSVALKSKHTVIDSNICSQLPKLERLNEQNVTRRQKRKAPQITPTPRKKQRICLERQAVFELRDRRCDDKQTDDKITQFDKLQISHSNGEISVHCVGDMISVFDKKSKQPIHGKICAFYQANTDISLFCNEGSQILPNYIKKGQKRVLVDWGWNLVDIGRNKTKQTLKRIIKNKVSIVDSSFYCALDHEVPFFDERNDELVKGIFIEDECSKYIGASDVVFSTKYKYDKLGDKLVCIH